MQPFKNALPAQWDDTILLIPMGIGLLILLCGGLWLLLRAFRQRTLWGFAVFLLPILGHLAFLCVHFKKAWLPTATMLLGLGVMAAPVVFVSLRGDVIATDAVIEETKLPPTPDGSGEPTTELRLTLTGAKRDEYSKLKTNKNFTVIQWANSDVTDEDTELLHGMGLCRELDLNDTAITDEALHVLEDMPKLEILRLARTKITLEGFQEHIQPLEQLMELDLRGTKVPGKVAREWKAAKPGRKLAI